ncbi:MAG: glycosyltransferase [Candidatus Limnocylindria bacterium]
MPEPAGRKTIRRGVFIIWGPPLKGRRSLVLGNDLGLDEVAYLADDWRPGLAGDPLKYPRLAWRTLRLLARRRPRVVFVQSPPTLAVWAVAVYAALSGAHFVIDAHSDAFQRARWTRPRWLNRIVARRATATLVTDPHWASQITADGAVAIVVPDIPHPTAEGIGSDLGVLGEGFHLLVVNTWSSDEPLRAILDAAADLPGVTFHVTGRRDERFEALGPMPANVRFTDFLTDDQYARLMSSVDAVVCLTTRDHTMQRGACEALSMSRPIVTSDWPLLRSYFTSGTVHVDNTAEGIRDGIQRLMTHYAAYAAAIAGLRTERIDEWQTRRAALIDLIATQTQAAAIRRRGELE